MAARDSALLVPASELPVLAWSFVAYLVWVYALPLQFKLETRPGLWLLSWAGYYAHHPLHEGRSWAEYAEHREFPA